MSTQERGVTVQTPPGLLGPPGHGTLASSPCFLSHRVASSHTNFPRADGPSSTLCARLRVRVRSEPWITAISPPWPPGSLKLCRPWAGAALTARQPGGYLTRTPCRGGEDSETPAEVGQGAPSFVQLLEKKALAVHLPSASTVCTRILFISLMIQDLSAPLVSPSQIFAVAS